MQKGAIISPNKKYRYKLWRIWDENKPQLLFIMLNPSTADESEDDPTITRCIGFAKLHGYGSVYVANLYAYRATDPDELIKQSKFTNIIGPDNFGHIKDLSEKCRAVIFAWGANATKSNLKNYKSYVRKVVNFLPEASCFGKTQSGHPKHPLYLKYETELEPFLGP